MITITRSHSFDAGHRVAGHESKCARLHGHTYTVHITATASSLDNLGRVIDFSVIKDVLCKWLDDHWDHKLLIWKQDEYFPYLAEALIPGLVEVPFNPTAEQMAQFLAAECFPALLHARALDHIHINKITIFETAKCSAEWTA